MDSRLNNFIEMSDKTIDKFHSKLSLTYKGNTYSFSIGDKYKRLTIKALVNFHGNGPSRKGCICECECGNFIGPSRLHTLINGELTSCGCYSAEVHRELLKEANYKHGDSTRENRTKLYKLWASMIDRATNMNRTDAIYYSMKGIGVCDEWRDYSKFRDWAMSNNYKDGLSIERKDVDKGYSPDNCTFILLKDQNKNKSNSRILEYNGIKMNMSDWCLYLNINWSTLDSRLKSGMSVGKALGFEK